MNSFFSRLIFKEVTQIIIKHFLQEQDGQTLVEYGLLISLIALVVIAVVTLFGRRVRNTFNAVGNQMTN